MAMNTFLALLKVLQDLPRGDTLRARKHAGMLSFCVKCPGARAEALLRVCDGKCCLQCC